ncbi:MAG: hypothetical protein ACSLE0_15400 [Chitinophagaceae bacterium]
MKTKHKKNEIKSIEAGKHSANAIHAKQNESEIIFKKWSDVFVIYQAS